MAVRIRMKKMGRKHRPFFRICATDARAPRDGKVIEELGHYDPMVKEKDARAVLNGERIDYWLSVGAQPSDNVRVLIKKYGSSGTHVQAQNEALERLKIKPQAPPPVAIKLPEKEAPPAPASASEAAATEDASQVTEGATESEDAAATPAATATEDNPATEEKGE